MRREKLQFGYALGKLGCRMSAYLRQ